MTVKESDENAYRRRTESVEDRAAEKRRKAERLKTGIPMTDNVFAEFIAISKDFEEAVIRED